MKNPEKTWSAFT